MPAIYWSNAKLKFTLGVGAMGMTGLFADCLNKTVPPWAVIMPVMVPVVAFLFSDMFSKTLALRIQQAASVFYVALMVVGIVMAVDMSIQSRRLIFYGLFMTTGLIPCILVFVGQDQSDPH